MTLEQFINTWNGKYNDYDNGYGPQCKDLFSQYNKDVANNPNYVTGDAWKLYDAAPVSHYEKILNTPTFVPRAGDVVIWKKEFGGYGHVAIFVSGDVNKMRVFGQNYPVVTKLDANNKVISKGSPCQIVETSYAKVHGFLRPKSLNAAPPPPPPPAEDPRLTEYRNRIDALEGQLQTVKSELAAVKINRDDLAAIVDQRNIELGKLQVELGDVKKQLEQANEIAMGWISKNEDLEIQLEKLTEKIAKLQTELKEAKPVTEIARLVGALIDWLRSRYGRKN